MCKYFYTQQLYNIIIGLKESKQRYFLFTNANQGYGHFTLACIHFKCPRIEYNAIAEYLKTSSVQSVHENVILDTFVTKHSYVNIVM